MLLCVYRNIQPTTVYVSCPGSVVFGGSVELNMGAARLSGCVCSAWSCRMMVDELAAAEGCSKCNAAAVTVKSVSGPVVSRPCPT